jgi:predicted nucleotidyltransferase
VPLIFGFADQRRRLLEEEFLRISSELGRLGVERFYLAGDLARDDVRAASDLEVVVVQETAEPPARRADFFTTHLRPSVGVRFHVFTPSEFESSAGTHPLLRETLALSPSISA